MADDLEARVEHWLARDPDPDTRSELMALRDARDTAALAERFGDRLPFGTAGLRGVVGAGPARMNRLVVQETAAGLADYLDASVDDAKRRGVVITYDARPDSRQFAEDAAGVLLAKGFRVYLTDAPQPTPVGAFAVLALRAAAGVIMTASHNPPEYNGVKVYWENGAQIIPPHDAKIAASIDRATQAPLAVQPLAEGVKREQLTYLDDEFTARYRARVNEVVSTLGDVDGRALSVAYTAMHGVGARLAAELLADQGVAHVGLVESQCEPDGSFPTVAFPNPEEPGAMDRVLALAYKQGATLAVANDPDADRLAVAARTADGDYVTLTGDQIGVLLGAFCLAQSDASSQIVCASLVSSRMLGRIAEASGAQYFETLTGFKWLANVALSHQSDTARFLFAYEEALGYALGQLLHDKDGLSALAVFVRMVAAFHAEGRTVFDQLERLYRQHGLFLTEQVSLKTQAGGPSITAMLRAAMPAEIGGVPVQSVKDLQAGTQRHANGETSTVDLPPGDVLVFYLEDDSRIIVRPSGTEPKTKCYYEVVGQMREGQSYDQALADARGRLDALREAHQQSLALLV